MLNFLIPNPINLLLFTCLLLFQRPIKAQPYKVSFCDDPSNYTSSSQFETNLHLLLSSLASNTAPSGFYNATVGENPNQIDGLAQCRGDVAAQICSDCLNTSAVAILQSCPYKKDATIRFDNCLLRYSDQRIFSVLDTGYWWYFASGPNVSDLDVFDAQLSSLLRNLSSAAASDASKFKTDVSGFTDFSNIYGLVQCTQDLSDGDCLSCFAYLISQIPTCCSRKPRVRIQTPSCYMRYETYPFFQTQPQPPPPPLSLLRPEGRVRDGNEDSSRSVFIILIPVIVTLVLFSAISICLLWRKKVKKAGGTNVGNREDIANLESLLFDLDTLRAATINFSDAKKLGEGGFGPVYKGELSDGQEIAVKRLALTSSQGLEELKNEVALVAKLQHRNLVRLLGCCLQEPEKLLVYAYVPNGSLDKVLFDKVKRFTLDWDRRYKIINGIARGLLYLHEDSQLRIIHRDLKASNILLDGEMNAKISDFGLARLFGGDQTEDNTSRIAGTFGYMAPEYIMHGQISRKSDVYSFGVLILEIVTGRKTSDFQESECPADLLSYIWHHWNQGTTLELLDHSVDSCPENEVLRCIHMGLLCVQEDPAVRPTMSAVVLMLNSFTITPPTPSAPAFIVRVGIKQPDLRFSRISNESISELRPLTKSEV